MAYIDMNADLGEGESAQLSLAVDQPILEVVSSTNVATGAHAGGGLVLAAVTAAAVAVPVAVGAHPSYRDRSSFGRVSQLGRVRADPVIRHQLMVDLVGQVLSVAEELARWGRPLQHCKPHGALYNDAVADPTAAAIVLRATQVASQTLGYQVALVTLPLGHLWRACQTDGWPVRAEGFMDRAYTPAGTLVPRSQPGAVLCDPDAMVANALGLARQGLSTLCVHGDTPGALSAARAARLALEADGWMVVAP